MVVLHEDIKEDLRESASITYVVSVRYAIVPGWL